MTEKNSGYLAMERDYLEVPQKIVKSYSKTDYTKLPDNVRDPIVANNIATWEFDNTSQELVADSDLFLQ
ncbi:MAG: hypothetical protein E7211_02455 [Clostridium lundense]|nr:hypothetical protein [Clostridium lundense]